MFTEKQLQRYAEVMFWGLRTARRKRFRRNDSVLIRFDADALPLAERLHAVLTAAGLNPIIRLNLTAGMQRSFFSLAKPQQLDFIAAGESRLCREIQGSISLAAPSSLTHLADVDARKLARSVKAQGSLRRILEKRESQGDFGWTLGLYPTAVPAAQAGLSIEQYTRQIAAACFLNKAEPVKAWQRVHREARRLKKWLNGLKIDKLRVESARSDLTVRLGEKRRWVGVTGRNIPSFELFVSPDWRGTEGVFFADQPSFRSGNQVAGVRMEFAAGKAVLISADQGEAFVRRQLAVDAGASRLGEFSLTDKRFSRIDRFMANTLYDENFGGRNGNCHIAAGSSYANTYAGEPSELTAGLKSRLGFNASALHWDFVNTERKRVTAFLAGGGCRVIYENGRFTR